MFQDLFASPKSLPIWGRNTDTLTDQGKVDYELEKINLRSPVVIMHQDTILSMALLEFPQNFLITSSRDGIIKVWK
jgi:hypothetical protein